MVQLGHALHHLNLPGAVQLGHHAGGFVGVHMGQHKGDGLSPLVLQGREHGFDVCLIHKGELPVFQGLGHLAQQLFRRLGPIGLFQHGPGVFQAALRHRLVGNAHFIIVVQHVLCQL